MFVVFKHISYAKLVHQNEQVHDTGWRLEGYKSCIKGRKGFQILSEYCKINHYHFICLFITDFSQRLSAFLFTRIPKSDGGCNDPGENKKIPHHSHQVGAEKKEVVAGNFSLSISPLNVRNEPCLTIQEPSGPVTLTPPELAPRLLHSYIPLLSHSHTRFPHLLHPRLPITESRMSKSFK